MIRANHVVPVALATLLAGCQMMSGGSGRSIDGVWRSGDGISESSLQGGILTTRLLANNEVVGQGTYSVEGNTALMNWLSLTNRQQREAICTMGAGTMNCQMPNGTTFVLNRVA